MSLLSLPIAEKLARAGLGMLGQDQQASTNLLESARKIMRSADPVAEAMRQAKVTPELIREHGLPLLQNKSVLGRLSGMFPGAGLVLGGIERFFNGKYGAAGRTPTATPPQAPRAGNPFPPLQPRK